MGALSLVRLHRRPDCGNTLGRLWLFMSGGSCGLAPPSDTRLLWPLTAGWPPDPFTPGWHPCRCAYTQPPPRWSGSLTRAVCGRLQACMGGNARRGPGMIRWVNSSGLQSSVGSLVFRRVCRSVRRAQSPVVRLSLWGHRRGRLKRNVWQSGRARANKVANASCPATVLPQNLQYPQLRHRPGPRRRAYLASGCLEVWGWMAAPRGVPNS